MTAEDQEVEEALSLVYHMSGFTGSKVYLCGEPHGVSEWYHQDYLLPYCRTCFALHWPGQKYHP